MFWGSTSELFELNKILITYVLTLTILGAWGTEMIIQKQFLVRRTPLDIPIILFLSSQIISTLFSMDSHVSFWGYYSRFNGGLLSLVTYFFLYYALVTHFKKEDIMTLVKWIIAGGIFVTVWGLPSHFGKDPTCYIFRKSFDVSCWTDAFKPTIRVFSTLGQPAWLAAYLAVLIPISITMFLRNFIINSEHGNKNHILRSMYQTFSTNFIRNTYYILLPALFYVCLLYANTRAGFIGFWLANVFFWGFIFLKKLIPNKFLLALFLIFNFSFLISNFFVGTPIEQLNKFTLGSLQNSLSAKQVQSTPLHTLKTPQTNTPENAMDALNITDSGNIRRIVWKGAIDVWKANPIFGTGVETFGLAYYQHRPPEHNLTSEWDYLYNKAHNEYLNYLATTGIVGLGTYVLLIGVFLFYIIKLLYGSIDILLNNNTTIKQYNNEYQKNASLILLIIGLTAGYITILVTNFFGFSVVIMNLFLFLIPGFVYILDEVKEQWLTYPKQLENHITRKPENHISVSQWFGILILLLTISYLLFTIFTFWQADQKYGLGYNLNRGPYVENAYLLLTEATTVWPSEPVFQDELSLAAIQLGFAYYDQKNATAAAQFIQQAVDINNKVLAEHPKYLPFWKTRVRMFYTLGEINSEYRQAALQAAQQAALLAPTDAKVLYNLGVMYGQSGNVDQSIAVLKRTLDLKPDYQDVYYALALMYREKAINENKKVIDTTIEELAEESLKKVLQINPRHEQAKKMLIEWKK